MCRIGLQNRLEARVSDTNTTGNGTTETKTASHEGEPNRRAFLHLTTGAFAAIGVANVAWPLIDQMNPDASMRALASIEVDLDAVEVGQSLTITWRGKPVFIRRRTQDEIRDAKNVSLDALPDPEADKSRAENPEWLVLPVPRLALRHIRTYPQRPCAKKPRNSALSICQRQPN